MRVIIHPVGRHYRQALRVRLFRESVVRGWLGFLVMLAGIPMVGPLDLAADERSFSDSLEAQARTLLGTVSAGEGDYTLVVLSANYCYVCRAEEQRLVHLQTWLKSKRITPVIVFLDDIPERALHGDVLTKAGKNSPLHALLLKEEAAEVPAAFLMSSQGRVVRSKKLDRDVLFHASEDGLFSRKNLNILDSLLQESSSMPDKVSYRALEETSRK